ncbi:MAG TPA: hypothetical protein VNB24_00905, partial [Acidimicrobiales bacterium]|nr:hypothetical protein [Acidimicrobiales bacterium]
RALADRLEHANANAVTIAHHYAEAARPGDVSTAVDWLFRAAENAVGELGWEEARALAARAAELLNLEEPGALPELRARGLYFHARFTDGLDGAAKARSIMDAVAAANALGDIQLAARAVALPLSLAVGEVHRQYVEAAISVLNELGNSLEPARAEITFALCQHLIVGGCGSEANDVARRYAEPLVSSPDFHTSLVALGAIAYAGLATGQLLRLDAFLSDAALAQAMADGPYWTFVLHGGRFIWHLHHGERAAFENELALMAAGAPRSLPVAQQLMSLQRAVMIAMLDGRFADAEDIANDLLVRARASADAGGWGNFLAGYALHMMLIRLEQGRIAELLPLLESSVATNPLAAVRLALAVALIENAEHARADELVAAFVDDESLPYDIMRPVAIAMLGEYLARTRDRRLALLALSVLEPFQALTLAPIAPAVCLGPTDRYRAMALSVLGRHDEAESHFDAALVIDERLKAPPLIARTQYWYARMLVDRGHHDDYDRARAVAEHSAATAREFGMGGLVRDSAELIARLIAN